LPLPSRSPTLSKFKYVSLHGKSQRMLTLSSNLMTLQFWLLTLFVLATGHLETAAALTIPAGPTDVNFVQDDASLPPPNTQNEIGLLQKESFEKHQQPMIAVTVSSMTVYGAQDYSIERFAYEWLIKWQSSAKGSQGELTNYVQRFHPRP